MARVAYLCPYAFETFETRREATFSTLKLLAALVDTMAMSANKVGYVSVANSFDVGIGATGAMEDVTQYAHCAVAVSIPPAVSAQLVVTYATEFDEDGQVIQVSRPVQGGTQSCLQAFDIMSQCMKVALSNLSDPGARGYVQTVMHKHKSRPSSTYAGAGVTDSSGADVSQSILYTKNDYGGYSAVPTAPGGFGAEVSLPINNLPSIYAVAVDLCGDLRSMYTYGDVTVSTSGLTLSDNSGLVSRRSIRHNGDLKLLSSFQVCDYGDGAKVGITTNTFFAYFQFGADMTLVVESGGARACFNLVLQDAPSGRVTLTLGGETFTYDLQPNASVTDAIASINQAPCGKWLVTTDGVNTITFTAFDFGFVSSDSLQVTGVNAAWGTVREGCAPTAVVLQAQGQWNKHIQVGPPTAFQICADAGVVHFGVQDNLDGAFVVVQTLKTHSSSDGCRLKAVCGGADLTLAKFALATEGRTSYAAFHQRQLHAAYSNTTVRGGQVSNIMSVLNCACSSSDVTVVHARVYANLVSSCLLHIILNASLQSASGGTPTWTSTGQGSSNTVLSCTDSCAVTHGIVIHTVAVTCMTTELPAWPIAIGEHLTFACEPLSGLNLVGSDICVALSLC